MVGWLEWGRGRVESGLEGLERNSRVLAEAIKLHC